MPIMECELSREGKKNVTILSARVRYEQSSKKVAGSAVAPQRIATLTDSNIVPTSRPQIRI